jgi:hypothetical protein
MRDRVDKVRKVVERYEGFEFVPLRIEDAFDSKWWASVGGRNRLKERDLGVDLSDEGKSIFLSYPLVTFNDKHPKNYLFRPCSTHVTLLR